MGALASADDRATALTLAIELGTPGLFGAAKKHLVTDEELVVKLGFATREKSSARFLVERWARPDLPRESFDLLSRELQRSTLPDPSLLEAIKGVLANPKVEPARRQAAEVILRFQLDLDASDVNVLQSSSDAPLDASSALLKRWKGLRAEHGRRAMVFALAGDDLLARRTWLLQDARRVGPNVRIRKGGSLSLEELPTTMREGSFVLKARLLILDGRGAAVTITFDDGLFSEVELTRTGWEILAKGGQAHRKPVATPGDWSELTLTVSERSGQRVASFVVDGATLMDNVLQTKRYASLAFESREGDFVVGGVELTAR
jgi:hypothetical protein